VQWNNREGNLQEALEKAIEERQAELFGDAKMNSGEVQQRRERLKEKGEGGVGW